MIKLLSILLSIILICFFVSCDNKVTTNNSIEKTDKNTQSTIIKDTNIKKDWSKQEIQSLFLSKANPDWTVIDCVTVSDFAFNRIGVVLFVDNKQITQVAFMDSEGCYQMCGTPAKLSLNPELTYCGNGIVTFKLQTEDNITYDCKISFSMSDDKMEVRFTLEDNLEEVTVNN